MKKFIGVAILGLLLLACFAVVGQGEKPDKGKTFMRAKLDHSQATLEALALADFDGIIRNANQMKLLSLDANWQVIQTLEYRRHSADFRRTTDALMSSAKDRNIDGAVLAYFQLTQTCVNCHKHVRDLKMD